MSWREIKQKLKKWQGTLFITIFITGLIIAGSNAGVFRLLEWTVLDQFLRLRSYQSVDDRIVIVTIDESDIKYVQQWPLSDRVMAQLIRHLKAQQPRGIVLDIYRDLPVEPGHAELVAEFKKKPQFDWH